MCRLCDGLALCDGLVLCPQLFPGLHPLTLNGTSGYRKGMDD